MRTERDKLTDLDSTNDEEKIVRIVQNCVSESFANQDKWAQRAKRNIQYFVGNQWLTDDGSIDESSPAWRFRTQLNLVFSNLMTICSAGLDARPRVYYSADVDTEKEYAHALTDIVDSYQEARMEEWMIYSILLWLTSTGIAWRKHTWDYVKNEPAAHILHSWNVGVDPEGTLPDCGDHNYLVHSQEIDADIIARKYNVDEDELIQYADKDESEGWLARRLFRRGSVANASVGFRPKVEIHELWYFGQTHVEFVSDGKPSKALKHPEGRVFTICGDKLIYKKENTYNHRRFPLVPYHGCTAPSGFLGFGITDQLVPIQFAINVLMSQYIMGCILMANPQWQAEEGAVTEGLLTNEPGLVIPVAPGQMGSIQQVPGVAPPTGVLNVVNELLMFSERVSNVSEVMQGRQPGANTSGIAIAGLQQAAMLIVRQIMRWFEGSHKIAAIIEAENIQQFFFPMDPMEMGEMSLGEWYQWQEGVRSLTFDVTVQSMSELPRNMEGRLAFGFQMLEAGVFDVEEFLDFTRISISERLREKLTAPMPQLGGGMLSPVGGGGGVSSADLQGLPSNFGQGAPA
jgi:hypothetical protein